VVGISKELDTECFPAKTVDVAYLFRMIKDDADAIVVFSPIVGFAYALVRINIIYKECG